VGLALLSACLLCGCENGCAGWNQVFERMVNQPKELPYGSEPFFDDGRAMRVPPEDTIPRERDLKDRRLTDGVAADGAFLRTFPLPVTQVLLVRGQNRFDIYCATCHSVLGDGDTPVADKMQLRRPPSLHEGPAATLTPGQLYQVVANGYGFMPGYAGQLAVNDRWAVVAYVKALQLSRAVPLQSLPPDLQAEARRALLARSGP
jgi:hypothetical protein